MTTSGPQWIPQEHLYSQILRSCYSWQGEGAGQGCSPKIHPKTKISFSASTPGALKAVHDSVCNMEITTAFALISVEKAKNKQNWCSFIRHVWKIFFLICKRRKNVLHYLSKRDGMTIEEPFIQMYICFAATSVQCY